MSRASPSRAADERDDDDPPTRALFACYLVVSLDPSRRGKSYVGFTVNPPRRLAQHNGAIAHGARYTASLRPCEMVLVVSGFASKTQALQFEWAWQHPARSRATREAAARAKITDKSTAPTKKAQLMCEMLGLAPWRHMPLSVHCMSERGTALIEKYRGTIPSHVDVAETTTREMERLVELSGNAGRDEDDGTDMGERSLNVDANGEIGTPSVSTAAATTACRASACGKLVQIDRSVGCTACGARFHATCLARHFFDSVGDEALTWRSRLIPEVGPCASCGHRLTWGAVLRANAPRITTSTAASPLVKNNNDDDGVTSAEKLRRVQSVERREKERARVRSWARDISDESESESDGAELDFVSSLC